MTREEELAERAARHGLVRNTADLSWAKPGGLPTLWREEAGWEWRASGRASPLYATEGDALTAFLHWLDTQHPEKAWRACPGAKLAEVRRTLNRLAHYLPTELIGEAHAAADTLQSLALPPASDEGEVLAVAWDYALTRGGLTGRAREALVRAVRACPEVVADAKLAAWSLREGGWMLCALAGPGSTPPGLGWVEVRGNRWRWSLHPEDPTEGWERTPEAAREACARALPAWRVIPTPAPPAPEAETAPGDTRGAHTWVEVGIQGYAACANPECQRYRTAFGRYATGRSEREAIRVVIVRGPEEEAGPCPARLP